MPSLPHKATAKRVEGRRPVFHVSNAGDSCYRPRQGRMAFVHTLNAYGLATNRLVPGLL